MKSPKSRAVAVDAPQRESHEPERALRRRNNAKAGTETRGGFSLHPLVLLFALSGSLMISRLRIPKP